jgi:alginate O-acetyltransferase complex protein AlgI
MALLSFSFAALFLLVFAVYWLTPGRRTRQLLLVAATLVWYAFGVWWHALAAIAMGSTAWGMGRWIASRPPEARGVPTAIGIALLVGFFVFFRYAALWSGADPHAPETLAWWMPNPLLAPVGLSFLMFESIGYHADLYLGRLEKSGSWWDHMVFTLYFPTRVIGPMRKFQRFVPQIGVVRRPTPDQVAAGLGRIGVGLFKKVVIANPLGTFALFNMEPAVFENSSPVISVLALYSYWLYLYFDFAGYSDIVIGLSRLLGIEVPENFDHPYRATNISDYWRRWHMSLSFWVREYVYTPLAIRWRRSWWGGPVGAFSSMVVLGLWHGIELRFLAFGVIHGLLLGAHMLLQERTRKNALAKRVRATRLWSLLGWAFVMNVAVWSHVFYATASWEVAMRFLRSAARLAGM